LGGSLFGPILFFVLFNLIRLLVRWYGIKYGYEKGTDVISDVAGNKLQKITEGASILGLFVMGALVNKWTSMNVPVVVSTITKQDGTVAVTTVQTILDQLMPGLLPLLLTFLCIKLMKNKVNPIWIIFGLFAVGILGYWTGILGM
jgi:PTS system mannose-specific IID component